MTTAAVRGVVRGLGVADPPTDADLVTAFAARRDEAAFAELLRRHGPLVFGVCRRILSDAHAAEDAFQAVFLVLARKVNAVRPPGLVAHWLYGVAVRTAKKAKVAEARRWRREMRHALASRVSNDAGSSPEHAELRAVIDDELAKLPERLRAAVVLCDLGGKSRPEAARELGCPEGTLASRLAKARRILADRLTRRGVTLPAAGLTALVAPVPPALAANTLAAALGAAASPAAHLLAESVVRTMTANKFKLLVAPWLVAAAVTGGAVALSRGEAKSDPPPKPAPAVARVAAQPPAKAPEMTWKEAKTLEQAGWLAGSVAYSADGKTLVVGGTGRVRAYDAATFAERWTAKVDGDAQHFAAVAFAHKDEAIAATFADGVRFLDAATGKVGNTLEEKGSKPTAVGMFPDEAVPVDVVPQPVSRKLVFDGATGYHINTWLEWPKFGTIDLNIGPKRRPAGDVPLAVDPKGKRVVLTGPIDPATGKNVLWAYAAGGGAGNALMEGHKATVTSAAWSADGTTIVTGDADGVVIAWDAGTFKKKSRAELRQRVQAVAVTANGVTCAAATIDSSGMAVGPPSRKIYTEQVFTWKTAAPPNDPKPIALPREGGGETFTGVAGLAFSPDGKSLAGAFCNFAHLGKGGDLTGKVRVWQIDEPKPDPAAKVPADGLNWVTGVTYSPDGKRFAVSPGVSVRDPSGKELYTAPGEAAGFSADGKTLFAMGSKAVTVHDAETGKETKSHSRPVTNLGWHMVSFSPDGSRYAAHFGFGVRVFDTATGFEPVRLENQREPGGSGLRGVNGKQVAFSPDGKRIVAVGVLVASGQMGAAVWDAASGNRLHTSSGLFDGPGAATFSADGQRFAIASKDKIVVHDAATSKVVKELAFRGQPTDLVFAPDGKTLAVGNRASPYPGFNGWTGKALTPVTTVQVIDAESGKVLHSLGGLPDLPVTSIAFAPDGTSIVAGTGIKNVTPIADEELRIQGGVKVWRLDEAGTVPVAAITGWKEATAEPLTHHGGPVDSVAWSPDGTSFVSGGADGKLLIWDAATRTPTELGAVIPAGKRTAVAFSPDGKLVAATRDKVTGFFDPIKRQVVLREQPLRGGRAVAYSPDGRWLAIGNGIDFTAFGPNDGDTTLWNALNKFWEVKDDLPAALVWSPDGALAAPYHDPIDGKFGIKVYAAKTWKETMLTGHTERVTSLVWSADGKRIATGAGDGHVIVWDAATFKEQHRVKISGRNGSSTIHALAFAPDGVTLAAAVQLDAGKGVNRVIMLDAATGTQGDFMQTWQQLRAVAFSPDGKTLLGACGIDRAALKPVMTPDELKAAGGIAVWQRAK